jgi:hypothetical protein
MVCTKFKNLEDDKRVLYQAQLLHVAQSDDELFGLGELLIARGRDKGLFEGVKFGNEIYNEPALTTDTDRKES